MSDELTCQQLIAFLDEYSSGEQAPEVRAEFERHLSGCPQCVDYLRTYQATVAIVHGACGEPDAAPPADAPEELIQAILQARRAGER